jgi:homoserine dehydrogenase
MAKKQVRIALLGFGTVGSGIYRIVTGMRDEIARREDV